MQLFLFDYLWSLDPSIINALKLLAKVERARVNPPTDVSKYIWIGSCTF